MIVHPAREMWLPSVQLMYATWLDGYWLTSILASVLPVMPASLVMRESTKT